MLLRNERDQTTSWLNIAVGRRCRDCHCHLVWSAFTAEWVVIVGWSHQHAPALTHDCIVGHCELGHSRQFPWILERLPRNWRKRYPIIRDPAVEEITQCWRFLACKCSLGISSLYSLIFPGKAHHYVSSEFASQRLVPDRIHKLISLESGLPGPVSARRMTICDRHFMPVCVNNNARFAHPVRDGSHVCRVPIASEVVEYRDGCRPFDHGLLNEPRSITFPKHASVACPQKSAVSARDWIRVGREKDDGCISPEQDAGGRLSGLCSPWQLLPARISPGSVEKTHVENPDQGIAVIVV